MLTIFQKRVLLFLFGCILTRSLIAYLAKTGTHNTRVVMAYVAIFVAISWIYLFFSGKRKNGPEVFGEGIWWNNLRPVHAGLYLVFAYMVLIGNLENEAWKVLTIDVIIGLVAWMVRTFI